MGRPMICHFWLALMARVLVAKQMRHRLLILLLRYEIIAYIAYLHASDKAVRFTISYANTSTYAYFNTYTDHYGARDHRTSRAGMLRYMVHKRT